MIELYHNFLSPYSRCVWMVIQAKKITVELRHTNTNETNSQDYIPTIIDDGYEIKDVFAILDYLEARYPEPTLLPQDPQALATVRMVQNISLNRLLPAIANYNKRESFASNCLQRQQIKREILSLLTTLENLLQHNVFFAGYQITLAEVTAGSAIPLLSSVGISLVQFPLLKAWLLRLTRWSAWVATKPSQISSLDCFQNTVERSDALPAIEQSFAVNFQYQVHFTKHLLSLNNPLLAQTITTARNLPEKAIAVVDGGLLDHYPQLISQIEAYAERWSDLFSLKATLVVAAGEAAKNDPQLIEKIHIAIEQGSICRHSYVLAIGGGAVLDMVGYAAATAHRGIRLIRIPTTVLSQNDSAVGVKNSINAFGKKNFLGTFAPPYAVINDLEFLTSLEDRDWRSGVAEAIKVALIKDADFFSLIASKARAIAKRDLEVMSRIVYRCAQLHLEHIATSGDPFEAGSSRPLDFGHWAAHRLEYLTEYRLRHGEAVAIGIALDCTYSYLQQLLSYSQWQQILITLTTLGFNLYVPELEQTERSNSLFQGIEEFREHLGGELTIMLLEQIGRGIEVHQVDLTVYERAIAELKKFATKQETSVLVKSA